MSEAFWTSVIVGCGTGASILLQVYRENRNRQWDQQDRERIAAESAAKLKEESLILAREVAQRAEMAARVADRRAETRQNEIVKAVIENTELTQTAVDHAQAAYTEANTVNKKIEKVGLQMKDNQPLNPNEPKNE